MQTRKHSHRPSVMATTKVTLKLLINKMERKVLFAEAKKDFVDFLFYIFSMPVGTVVKLLKNNTMSMMGCLGELYQSIETLSETYIQPNQTKNSVLNPKSPTCPTEIPLWPPANHYSDKPKASNFPTFASVSMSSSFPYNYSSSSTSLFKDQPTASNFPTFASVSLSSSFPYNYSSSSTSLFSVAAGASTTAVVAADNKGFVKDVVTYMVMDNLEVMPMSTITSISLLNKFNVRDMGTLEEKVVDFGLDEGLKLLKASMECKNVLTSVFLRNMEA